MTKPLIFISHKHDDREIANSVAKFVRDITGGQVDVYVSSNPEFEGPRIGKELNEELKRALWDAGVVILIYTSEDKDWSWCMWECGLAEDPQSPDTKVIVLQCLPDKPKVFQSGLNALAWVEESLVALAYRFGEPNFFPGRDEPVTGLNNNELKDRAGQLHNDLKEVIQVSPAENWSAWPFFRLKLSQEQIEALRQAENPTAEDYQELLRDAVVTISTSGSAQLFGKTEVGSSTPLSELIDEWTSAYPARKLNWLSVIAQQVIGASKKGTPRIKNWNRIREVNGQRLFVPGFGRVKSFQNDVYFDCYFYGISEAQSVSTLMVRRERMFHLDFSELDPSKILLSNLLGDLQTRHWHRIPILDQRKVKYIIHDSMINRFIVDKLRDGDSVEDLTLQDLLADQKMEKLFSHSFVVVNRDSTLDDARRAMFAADLCQDVFVTRTGSVEEDVEGWMTDRDLYKAEAAVA